MAQKSQRPGAARERLLAAALELFARHGVSGTSLQMIADELGVTKAAVYHQFQSKDDIVWAVVAPALEALSRVADAAEAQRRRGDRLEIVLTGIVDLVVAHRSLATVIQADPAVNHLIRDHPAMRALEERLNGMLSGPDPDPEALVGAVIISGGLMIAGTDPRLSGLDDETLRRHLLGTARRILRPRARSAS